MAQKHRIDYTGWDGGFALKKRFDSSKKWPPQMIELKDECQMENKPFIAELQENYGIVTHQMNTALTTLQLLLDQDPAPRRKDLQAELVSLKRYIDIILPFLQVHDLSEETRREPLDLHATVKRVLRRSALQFIAHENRLDLQPLQGEVLSNERWLTLLIELALFAVSKDSKKDTITIQMDPAREGSLIIENHSESATREDMARIMEEDYAGPETRKMKQTTGIELYLCHQIAGRLSHRLQVTSNESKGMRLILAF